MEGDSEELRIQQKSSQNGKYNLEAHKATEITASAAGERRSWGGPHWKRNKSLHSAGPTLDGLWLLLDVTPTLHKSQTITIAFAFAYEMINHTLVGNPLSPSTTHPPTTFFFLANIPPPLSSSSFLFFYIFTG